MLRQLYVVALILLSACALKMHPPPYLNETNFPSLTGVSLDTFLQNGSADHAPWFILFKIPQCKHCEQAEMLFQSFFIEYNKRIHFEADTISNVFETNFHFAFVDCGLSSTICNRFNVEQYPTYYVLEGNGDACRYMGDRMPYSLINYLEERKRGEGKDKCKPLGKITTMTRLLDYFEPLIQLMNYNTALFILAFVVGPFLFGFVFSRTKKQKIEQAQALQQEQKTE